MHDFKGRILVDSENPHSLTCCEHRPHVKIDGVSLRDCLMKMGELGSLESQEDYEGDKAPESKHVKWAIRYVVRDRPFLDGEEFEGAVLGVLYSDEVRGCYSEWTCGTGDYDFVLEGSHSILTELAGHEGKYVWLKLT